MNYTFKIATDNKGAVTGIHQIKDEVGQLKNKVQQDTQAMKNHFHEAFSGMKGLLMGAMGIGGIFAGFEFIKSSKEAYDKLEESVVKVETAIISTHGAAKLSTDELTESAKKLSQQELFSRAQIIDAQSMLLTFTGIKGAVFNDAIPAIMDFATRYKTDPVEAALQVGKALNDPEQGLHRLTRMGVVFSAQQEEQIKHFMAINDVASAQRVMLNELNTEFGGLANAMAKTDEGKLKMVGKRMAELKITIGETISKMMISLIPVFEKFIKIITDLIPYIKIAFEILVGSIEKFAALIERIWPILKYVVDLMLIWGAIKAFDMIVTGVIGFYNYLTKLPAIISGVATGLNSWTLPILTALAGILLIKSALDTEKSKDLLAPLDKTLGKIITRITELESEGKTRGNNPELDRLYRQASIIDKQRDEIKNEYGDPNSSRDNLMGFKHTLNQIKRVVDDIMPKIPTAPDYKNIKSGGIGNSGAITDAAINTSNLSGASGGLGEAKIIHMHFNKALVENNIPGGNGLDILAKSPQAAEMILRILNNIAPNQGATM
jgi:hypothetical protein